MTATLSSSKSMLRGTLQILNDTVCSRGTLSFRRCKMVCCEMHQLNKRGRSYRRTKLSQPTRASKISNLLQQNKRSFKPAVLIRALGNETTWRLVWRAQICSIRALWATNVFSVKEASWSLTKRSSSRWGDLAITCLTHLLKLLTDFFVSIGWLYCAVKVRRDDKVGGLVGCLSCYQEGAQNVGSWTQKARLYTQ